MSIAALDWAFKQPIEKSSQKFVLVAMANYASEAGETYPSIARLCFDTGQDDRTIRKNIKALVKLGFLVPTGHFAGHRQQVPIYVIAPYLAATPPKNGSGPPLPKMRVTPPKNVPRPLPKMGVEPSLNQKQPPERFAEKRKSQEPDPEKTERLKALADFASRPWRP